MTHNADYVFICAGCGHTIFLRDDEWVRLTTGSSYCRAARGPHKPMHSPLAQIDRSGAQS